MDESKIQDKSAAYQDWHDAEWYVEWLRLARNNSNLCN